MQALIERLQAASEGSRELDAYIWAHQDCRHIRINDNNLVLAKSRKPPHDECVLGTVDPGKEQSNFQIAGHLPPIPHYTTSLDAALTLVPEGWQTMINERKEGWEVILSSLGKFVAAGNTPKTALPNAALALCIAALKARMEVE